MSAPIIGIAMGTAGGIYAELATAVEAAARDGGYEVERVADAAAAGRVDVVVGVGYPQYFRWLDSVDGRRVAWLGEPLPPARETRLAAIRRELPMGRLLDAAIAAMRVGGRGPSPRVQAWRERATSDHMQRINLRACRLADAAGIELVMTAADQAVSLERFGIAVRAVPFGYHPALAGPLQPVDDAARDLDVVVFGTGLGVSTIRRARLTDDVVRGLDPSIRTHVVRGAVWGEERQRLLGRARVALSINQAPGTFMGIRALLLGAAGAVNVCDPIDTPAPFIPGVHYLEAPVDRLADTVREILADRPRRLEIARCAQRLMSEGLTMARSLDAVLEPRG